jgi:hypothetical protein
MSTILEKGKHIQKVKEFIKIKSPGQLIFGRNILNVHQTKSGKYIQKVKELYFITQQEKSPRQLVFGKT